MPRDRWESVPPELTTRVMTMLDALSLSAASCTCQVLKISALESARDCLVAAGWEPRDDGCNALDTIEELRGVTGVETWLERLVYFAEPLRWRRELEKKFDALTDDQKVGHMMRVKEIWEQSHLEDRTKMLASLFAEHGLKFGNVDDLLDEDEHDDNFWPHTETNRGFDVLFMCSCESADPDSVRLFANRGASLERALIYWNSNVLQPKLSEFLTYVLSHGCDHTLGDQHFLFCLVHVNSWQDFRLGANTLLHMVDHVADALPPHCTFSPEDAFSGSFLLPFLENTLLVAQDPDCDTMTRWHRCFLRGRLGRRAESVDEVTIQRIFLDRPCSCPTHDHDHFLEERDS